MQPLDLLNLAALSLLGAGFLWKDRRSHLLRMAGWSLEGIFWLTKVPHYLDIDDQFNALGALAACPIFLYLGYQEHLSHRWNDDYPPLKFVTGAMFIAGMGYFLIDNFPPLSQFMIDVVAHQSVWLANLPGYDFGVGDISPVRALLTNMNVPISIVLECTAIQAYFVAGAFLFGCRGPWLKRAIAFLIIAPTVWLVNLFRNAIVIIMVHNNGSESFDFAHNVLGKGLSLTALVLMVLVAFILVPQLYEDINGLFELPWRKGPNHDYLRFVGRLYGEKDSDTGRE